MKLWGKKRGINFGKHVQVMTSFDDVTIVLTKFEYALAPSFDLIY